MHRHERLLGFVLAMTVNCGFVRGAGSDAESTRMKQRQAFDEWERTRPEYRVAVSNWTPDCAAFSDVSIAGRIVSSSPSHVFMRYDGTVSNKAVFVIDVYKMDTGNAAHVILMKHLDGSCCTLVEKIDAGERIGDRCFWGEDRGRTLVVSFIRNNVSVRVMSMYNSTISPVVVAAELDRQIVDICGEPVPGSGKKKTGVEEQSSASDDASK